MLDFDDSETKMIPLTSDIVHKYIQVLRKTIKNKEKTNIRKFLDVGSDVVGAEFLDTKRHVNRCGK